MTTFPTDVEIVKYDHLYLNSDYSQSKTPRMSKAYRWLRARCLFGNSSILDLGCGAGFLADMIDGYSSYHGVDIAGQWIRQLQSREKRLNVRFSYANLADLPFGDQSYDFGFSLDVLEHIPPDFVDQVLSEMKRVCRNLCLCICTRHHKIHPELDLHLTVKPGEWWLEKFDPVDFVIDQDHVMIVQGPNTMTPAVSDPFAAFRGMSGVRFPADGTLQLLRHNKRVEARLDEQLERVPNELKWRPHINEQFDVMQLKDAYVGHKAYIVGKGPSLDKLSAADFPDPTAPILAINEAFWKVDGLVLPNPVYLIQFDSKVDVKPTSGDLILHQNLQSKYPACNGKQYLYSEISLGCGINLTCLHALRIASRIFGCNRIDLLCFDAALTKDTGYAQVVGYTPKLANRGPEEGMTGERFLKHKQYIEAHAEVSITFRLPQSELTASYTPVL